MRTRGPSIESDESELRTRYRTNASRAPSSGRRSAITPALIQTETTFEWVGIASLDDIGLPVYFRPCPGARRLVVLLPGAIDRTSYDVVYQRASWAPDFDAHVLSIADPTVLTSQTAVLGWFQGADRQSLYRDLANCIESVASAVDVAPADVVLYGSSAGGFAALKLTEHLASAKVVAVNPQLYLDRYIQEYYEAMLALSYPEMTRAQVEAEHYANLEVSSLVVQREAPTLILQNTYDVLHFRYHVRPFLIEHERRPAPLIIDELGGQQGFHTFTYTNLSEGHVPPDRETETRIITSMLDGGPRVPCTR